MTLSLYPAAYRAGWVAYDNRVDFRSNPHDYTAHPGEHDGWTRGWFDAELDHEHED